MVNREITVLATGIVAATLAVGIFANPVYTGPVTAQEVRVRAGVGHFMEKIKAGKEVKVAYLGGSITAMNGWRNLTTDWLRATYPQAKFKEIHASIGGTGSNLGAFRVEHDALRHNPDLLFVEFATNDSKAAPEAIWRSMEGIVRQTWKKNPATDIVFAYTITEAMKQDYLAGKCNRAASAMEQLADHYGIPSICFGPRVIDAVKAGTLVMSGKDFRAGTGKTLFAKDGVHPAPAGHRIYLASVVNGFTQMKDIPPADHAVALRTPFVSDNLEAAKMVEIKPSMLIGDWKKLPPSDGKVRAFGNRMGEMWYTGTPGATLRFTFRGTCCQIYDLLGPDGGQVWITVDGKKSAIPVARFDSYCTYHRIATLGVFNGADGVHTVEITVDKDQPSRQPVAFRLKNPAVELAKPKYQGTKFWPAKIMLVGDLVAEAVKSVATNDLSTAWGRAVTPENVWREYPRPQLVRGGWVSLNGSWEYAIVSVEADEPAKYDGTILVPFGVETPLSGVRRKVKPEDQIWYRRTFTAHPRKGFRTILNFERVDFRAHVFVNGQEVTDVPHAGGNVPFSVDATPFVKDGENELKLLVWDPSNTHLGGTGKQVLTLRSCFFPATSGICGTVWMETVPETYLADYKIDTDIDKGTVAVTPFLKGRVRAAQVEVSVSFGGKELVKGRLDAESDAVTLVLPKPLKLWSCDAPNLYDLAITVKDGGVVDSVKGYFGMRKVATALDAKGVRRVTINGQFTYLLGTLDQGWWPDGYLTPPSADAMRYDVDLHKKLGFNAVRKHIKVEPRLFYAYCDKVGLMVLQDMPSGSPNHLKPNRDYSNRRYGFFRRELKDVVDHLHNHPSIVMWIPFNEGWGQPTADKTRFTGLWLKRYDPSRLVDGPSGWNDYEGGDVVSYIPKFTRKRSTPCEQPSFDVVDKHVYPHAVMFEPNATRVTMTGEFGGVSVYLQGHFQDMMGRPHLLEPVEGGDWRERIWKRYEQLARPLVKMAHDGLSGSIYTEITDQFWEGAGFVTFDRAVEKYDSAAVRRLHQEILDAAKAGAEGK